MDDLIELQGEYKTPIGKHLEMLFVPCNQTANPECKSEDEYKSWAKGKFFLLLHNKVIFNNHGFYNETYKDVLSVDGVMIENDRPYATRYLIQNTEAETADSYLFSN